MRQLVGVYDLATDAWIVVPSTATAFASPQAPRSMAGISMDFESGRVLLFGGLVVTSSDTTGQRSYSLSKEIDVLEVNKLATDKWTWAAATERQVQPPGIAQPIQHYLPLLHATFVMGGATTNINPANGTFTQCNVFNAGYLIYATGSTTELASSIPVTNVELRGSLPTPRVLACTVVLSNGDVFMYGGTTPNETLNDAWILNTRSWTWSNMPIKGLPVNGRAGSTCQMATVNQLLVVGGYTITSPGVKDFAAPQLAIIDTDSWTWTLNFKPGPPSPMSSPQSQSSSTLSTGAIVGSALGCCFLIGVLLFFLARKFKWRKQEGNMQNRRKRLQGKLFSGTQSSGTQSSEPLVHSDELRDQHDDDVSPDSTVRTSMIPFAQMGGSVATTQGRGPLPWPESLQQGQEQKQYFLQHQQHQQQQQQQQHPQQNQIYPQKQPFKSPTFPQPSLPLQSPVVVKQLSSVQVTTLNAQQRQEPWHSNQSKKPSSPFLIIPYVPDDSAFSTSSTAPNSDSNGSLDDTQTSPHNTPSWSTASTTKASNNSSNGSERRKLGLTDLPKSIRMPHTLADMHHGQYVKTLQHHKQYERRRQEELRLNSGLARSGTQESMARLGGNNYYGYDDEDDDLGLATGVLRLREVDLGEESISGSVNGLEAGTILLSSHLETSALESEGILSEWS
ncbi:hypothetical protein BG006_009582 [Podila minutissima]|uniref:Galactose oxidase n=1 Tax=Podila minutissima TaxID=64525 RepID=A0A9P5SEJ7_9FUNG|nr:hypothetical protein BG006_009582 [Podila minutissima]